MLMDSQLLFSDAQAITTTAASKFYKCPGGATSHEIVEIRVDEAVDVDDVHVVRTRSFPDAGTADTDAAT